MQVTYTTTPSHQKIRSGSYPLPGLANIPCLLGPIIEERPTDGEVRTSATLEHTQRRHLKMNGSYPQIQERDMEAVVDGVTFPIRGVESDSKNFSTRLRLEVVRP